MRIRHPLIPKLAGWLVAVPLKLLAYTLRYDPYPAEAGINPTKPDCKRYYLFATWHDTVIMAVLARVISDPKKAFSGLVSQHQDGEFLVEAMKRFRINSIRGSTTRGGAQAIKQLLDQAGQSHIFFTPDGPQGPCREMKNGILYLASQTGIPIIPTAFVPMRKWVIKGSWTNFVLPRPFTRVVSVLGAPFHVPADLRREELENYRQRLQAEMDRANALAEDIAAGRATDQAPAVSRAA